MLDRTYLHIHSQTFIHMTNPFPHHKHTETAATRAIGNDAPPDLNGAELDSRKKRGRKEE